MEDTQSLRALPSDPSVHIPGNAFFLPAEPEHRAQIHPGAAGSQEGTLLADVCAYKVIVLPCTLSSTPPPAGCAPSCKMCSSTPCPGSAGQAEADPLPSRLLLQQLLLFPSTVVAVHTQP